MHTILPVFIFQQNIKSTLFKRFFNAHLCIIKTERGGRKAIEVVLI